MSVPLSGQVSECFLDDGLAKLLVLGLVVGMAEPLRANFETKLVVGHIKLMVFIACDRLLILAFLFVCCGSIG